LAVYFYKPLLSLFDLRQKDSQKMWLLLVVATLATGVVGLPLKHTFEQEYANIPRMAVTLAMTGALLWLSGRCVAKRAMNRILDWKIALLMGVGQAIALEPGISRSATTICFALFLGVEREEAFRFSMLMSMPAVLLASLLKLKDGGSLAISVPAVGVGITIAFVAGLLTLWWLKRLVVSDHFARFGYYCWALAAAVLIFVR
jgi:undecaprenyl-diphosphatase